VLARATIQPIFGETQYTREDITIMATTEAERDTKLATQAATLGRPPASSAPPDAAIDEQLAAVEDAIAYARATQGEGREIYLRHFMRDAADAMAREFTFRGVSVAPEQILSEVERRERERIDATARERATYALRTADALDTAIDVQIEARKELQLRTPAAQTDQLLFTIASQNERQETRLRFNGRPLRHLVHAYEASDDARDAVFIAFVEREARESWPTLQPGDDDPKYALQLQRVMSDRREARVPATLREQKARLQTLLGDRGTRALLAEIATPGKFRSSALA
jgi:hypothetical protein